VTEPSVALEQVLSAGAHAHPGLDAPGEALRALLCRQLASGGPREEHAADLYLTCAAATGAPAALERLDQHLSAAVSAALSGTDRAPPVLAEVRQLLRERLLVGDPPRVLDYTGRGPLHAWLRVAALRVAHNRRRASSRQAALPSRAAEASDLLPAIDPELAIIRARYKGEFPAALRAAFAELPPRDRVVFRMHFLDGLNIERIGLVFRVHRATVARWISAGRATLAERTLALLGERLRLDPAELQSLLRVVRSSLELSLGQVLAEADGEAPP
jgi:RNA polymerase sigma-70 factor (ECF subfamily)